MPNTKTLDPNISKALLFKKGVIACIPTLLGYWAVGFGCGAVGASIGFSIAQIATLSLLLYAGSAQFLFYSLAQQGADLLQIALAVGFINMRYLLINTYMAQFFAHSTLIEKLIGGLLMTDETFGVASQYARKHENKLPFSWLLGLNLTAWISWFLACVVGAFFVTLLPKWLQEGLEFSLVGMFVGLLLIGWYASQTRKIDIVVVIAAMGFMAVSQGFISNNVATILAAFFAATIGFSLLFYKKRAPYE